MTENETKAKEIDLITQFLKLPVSKLLPCKGEFLELYSVWLTHGTHRFKTFEEFYEDFQRTYLWLLGASLQELKTLFEPKPQMS